MSEDNGSSPENSSSSNDITPQTNNIQNDEQQDLKVDNTNKTYDWTNNVFVNDKQNDNLDTTGLQMNELNEVMQALSTENERQPDYEAFDKEALLSVEQLLGKQKIYVDKIDKGVIKMMELITGNLMPGKIIE